MLGREKQPAEKEKEMSRVVQENYGEEKYR
jgi:hypothetical protein